MSLPDNVERRHMNLFTEVLPQVVFRPHVTIPRLCERYGTGAVIEMTALTTTPLVVAVAGMIFGNPTVSFIATVAETFIAGVLINGKDANR